MNTTDRRESQASEKSRGQLAKGAYCELIQYELQKLTEDQLFKTLVLIKNTTDENSAKLEVRKPTKNYSLFPIDRSTNGEIVEHTIRDESASIKAELISYDFTYGYGVFDMPGYSSLYSIKDISLYICFCIPNVLDAMIEVGSGHTNNKDFYYIISYRLVGENKITSNTFRDRMVLSWALKNLNKQYNNKDE